MSEYSLQVLGTYGIPNNYGGAEQFIEMLAPFLVEEGWKVRVFCQIPGNEPFHITNWNGVELYHVPGKGTGPKSTIDYDIRCMRYALKSKMPILTMGYNTAFLNLPNLYCTPHTGGSSAESVLAMGRSSISHLVEYFGLEPRDLRGVAQ